MKFLEATARRIRYAASAFAALTLAFSLLLAAADTRCEPVDAAGVAECGTL